MSDQQPKCPKCGSHRSVIVHAAELREKLARETDQAGPSEPASEGAKKPPTLDELYDIFNKDTEERPTPASESAREAARRTLEKLESYWSESLSPKACSETVAIIQAAITAALSAKEREVAELREERNFARTKGFEALSEKWAVEAERDELRAQLDKLQAENAGLKGLLGSSSCPNCGGQGFYPTFDGEGNETGVEQCQWCDERTKALATPAPATGEAQP